MPFIIGGAILGTAIIGGVASNKAAKTQAKGAGAAADLQFQQYQQTREDLMPWQDSGKTSLWHLMRLEGMNDALPQEPGYGSLAQSYTGDNLQNDPGYQFGMQQGEQAINRRASAMHSRLSPATLQALSRFNQDYAGTKFNEGFQRDLATKQNKFNQLFALSTAGQNAATQTGYQGMNAATNAGNAIMQGANASAAGTVGVANAVQGGLSQGINMWQQQRQLDQYLNARYGGGAGNAPYPTGTSNYGWEGSGSTGPFV
jgi:hypothetical protein